MNLYQVRFQLFFGNRTGGSKKQDMQTIKRSCDESGLRDDIMPLMLSYDCYDEGVEWKR